MNTFPELGDQVHQAASKYGLESILEGGYPALDTGSSRQLDNLFSYVAELVLATPVNLL